MRTACARVRRVGTRGRLEIVEEMAESLEMGNGPQTTIPLDAPAVRRFGPYDWACKKSA